MTDAKNFELRGEIGPGCRWSEDPLPKDEEATVLPSANDEPLSDASQYAVESDEQTDGDIDKTRALIEEAFGPTIEVPDSGY
jgi:hypothetical protein